MHRYVGLDLVKSDWQLAKFELGPTDVGSVPKFKVGSGRNKSASIFDAAAERCRIKQRHFQPSTLYAEDRVFEDWIGPLIGQFMRIARNIDVAGFCHPYNVPPAVRRGLKVLVHGRNARGGAASMPASCISAPLAACLGWLATGRYKVPANLLVLDGTPEAPELTAIAIRAQAEELQLRVCSSMKLDGSIDNVRPRIGSHINVADGWRLCICGETLVDIATEVASRLALPKSSSTQEDGFSAAYGTALFARFQHLLAEERNGERADVVRFPGTPFRRIDVRHVFPYSLGVLGTGSDPGQWFWRRLFRADESLADTESQLTIGAKIQLPSCVMLAECREGNRADLLWLGNASSEESNSDFERLRIFTSAKLPNIVAGADDETRSLCFTINNPSGVDNWSDQTVTVR